MLSCVHGYHESGWRAWDGGSGRRTLVRIKATKSNGSLCCCSKERW